MKTPLAWRNLVHNKVRTFVAVAGVAFAVVLVFMQLGFRGAVVSTATLIYQALDFDVLIRSVEYISFADARTFPISRLPAASGAPGVQSVAPLWVQINQWRNPLQGSPREGTRRAILVIGVSPSQPAFKPKEIRQKARRLTSPEYALIDRASRKEFGPQQGDKFGDADIGLETNVGMPLVRIIGHYQMGAGLAADGSLITSDRGFVRITPGRTLEDVSFGLVKLAPGVDPRQAAEEIDRLLPAGVEVLTRRQAEDVEIDHWLKETPIGLIFQMGVVISLIVGIAIVYQVLSSDVAARLHEYATLKAMGYANKTLAGVVISQALILSILGYLPGLAVSLVLYWFTSVAANIPIQMTPLRVIGVLLLTVAMCAASGVAALRKIWVADPAELF